MGEMKVVTTYLNWSQHSVPHSSSSPQTLASTMSSPSNRRRATEGLLRYANTLDGLAIFGYSSSSKLYRTRSCEIPNSRGRTIRRSCNANMEAFSDEDFSNKIQELAMRFQLSDAAESSTSELDSEMEFESDTGNQNQNQNQSLFHTSRLEPFEPPDWHDIIPGSIEMKANSVTIPLSLRMIKRKKQWKQGEFASSSVKKAFSSMVFIIRELQSYTLQMRQVLFYEDLQGILVRVQKEMNASFVWLFQQVFSHTPTLMLYVMILLANYSVYSMASNTTLTGSSTSLSYAATTESVSELSTHNDTDQKFDSSAIKTFSVSSSSGKTTSIGGNNGGGGKLRSVASGTDGDGRFDGSVSDYHRTVVPDGTTSIGNPSITGEEESVSGHESREEELSLWNIVVEEASSMQAVLRDESLDHETMQRFVSPVTAKIDSDDYAEYLRTELLYLTGLLQEPGNPLLLANYAQFLYLVARDYDSAEDYFKRAANVEPKDAEALSKYASFLWQARKDLWAAEETYLEAISIDPSNSYYAANYAHFLWSTGGEDTCFPLSSPDTNTI